MNSAKLESLEQAVAARFPAARLERLGDALVMYLEPAAVVATMTALRDDPALDFKIMIDVTGVHYPGRDPEFDVVYQLLSVHKNHRLRVKVALDAATPLDSVTGVWSCADWFERELYEMFGILIRGHHDLRRLLTEYDFEGYPLRKDFPLTGTYEMRYDRGQRRVIREPINLDRADTRPDRRYYNRDES